MSGLLLPVLMFGALGAMMFFGMRKQKRQAGETKRMQDQVQPGARVMTTSGLHATVTATADDTIELEIAPGVYTTWVRAAIRDVVVPAPVSGLATDDDLGEYEYEYENEVDIRDEHEVIDAADEADSRPLLEKRSKDIG